MDAYDNYAACARADRVRRCPVELVRPPQPRPLLGARTSTTADKLDAYWTLYECLLTTAKLIAPFMPFLAEAMWQNLAVTPFGKRTLESVHLCDYPDRRCGDAIDEQLSERMSLVREISSLGRAARTAPSSRSGSRWRRSK